MIDFNIRNTPTSVDHRRSAGYVEGGGSGIVLKESIHRPAPVRNFFYRKKCGPQRKDCGRRYGSPGSYRVLCLSPAWKAFLRGQKVLPESSPIRFSFGGGSVHFVLLCIAFLQAIADTPKGTSAWVLKLSLTTEALIKKESSRNRVLGRGCDEAEISEEKRFFTEWVPGIQ